VDSVSGAHKMTDTFDTVMYATGRTPDTAVSAAFGVCLRCAEVTASMRQMPERCSE
jgi:hypothetical protein